MRSQLLELCTRVASLERITGVPSDVGGGISCNDSSTWTLVRDVLDKTRR
jgi:hypothetical protein